MILTGIILACAALAADGLSATNAPLPSAAAATNNLQTVENRSDLFSTVWKCAKIMYQNVPDNEFSLEDLAEELANSAEEGLHIRNGQILVVVRLKMYDGEHRPLAELRAKSRAVEFLRYHFSSLPKKIPCHAALLFLNAEKQTICVLL